MKIERLISELDFKSEVKHARTLRESLIYLPKINFFDIVWMPLPWYQKGKVVTKMLGGDSLPNNNFDYNADVAITLKSISLGISDYLVKRI
jgi:hypothetical protein